MAVVQTSVNIIASLILLKKDVFTINCSPRYLHFYHNQTALDLSSFYL